MPDKNYIQRGDFQRIDITPIFPITARRLLQLFTITARRLLQLFTISARRLLQYFQLPDKNSRNVSRYIYNCLRYFKTVVYLCTHAHVNRVCAGNCAFVSVDGFTRLSPNNALYLSPELKSLGTHAVLQGDERQEALKFEHYLPLNLQFVHG